MRAENFGKIFKEKHGVEDNYDIKSRHKKLWMEFPSLRAKLSEYFYRVVYFKRQRLGLKDLFRFNEWGSKSTKWDKKID